MQEKVTSIDFHITFDNLEEREIYDRLDLIIQFMLKNHLNGSVVLNRRDYIPCDDDED